MIGGYLLKLFLTLFFLRIFLFLFVPCMFCTQIKECRNPHKKVAVKLTKSNVKVLVVSMESIFHKSPVKQFLEIVLLLSAKQNSIFVIY
jgi:hypothetical protein